MARRSRGSDKGRGRVVVITGATAGVGLATAQAFAREDVRLGLIARDRARLESVRDELTGEGTKTVAVSADVADDQELDRAADDIAAELGPIDIWVNNAMVSILSPFTDITAAEFRRVTDVTYLGCVNGTRTALRHMHDRDEGVIVQVGSALAYRSIPMQSAYCGAKHAAEGFTESVRCELMHRRSGIRITTVHLPAMNTPQFDWIRTHLPRRARPVAPIFQPEVAGRAVVDAAFGHRREIWVGWSTTRAIVANRVAPGLLDRYLARRGVDAQQDEEPTPADRPDNLWQPVRADVGAHGRFDEEAHRRSPALWCSEHRAALVATVCSLAAAGAAGWRGRARR